MTPTFTVRQQNIQMNRKNNDTAMIDLQSVLTVYTVMEEIFS